jgi:hypothetical protein
MRPALLGGYSPPRISPLRSTLHAARTAARPPTVPPTHGSTRSPTGALPSPPPSCPSMSRESPSASVRPATPAAARDIGLDLQQGSVLLSRSPPLTESHSSPRSVASSPVPRDPRTKPHRHFQRRPVAMVRDHFSSSNPASPPRRPEANHQSHQRRELCALHRAPRVSRHAYRASGPGASRLAPRASDRRSVGLTLRPIEEFAGRVAIAAVTPYPRLSHLVGGLQDRPYGSPHFGADTYPPPHPPDHASMPSTPDATSQGRDVDKDIRT